MAPFPVEVRYRYNEGGEARNASFYGLFFDRSDKAVLDRLREVHRLAARIEIVGMHWRGGPVESVSVDDRRECISYPARSGCVQRADKAAMTIKQDNRAEQACNDAVWQPRRHVRCSMFKPAYVVLEESVLDCVLLDLSLGGAQVYLIAHAEVPDRVTLWLPGGESRAVRRCWQRGSHIGFEAVGDAVPPS